MTTRRELLVASVLGIGLAHGSVYALAAETRLRRIGLLSPVFPITDARWQAFLAGMRELGYTDGRNVAFVWRSAEGKHERIAALAEELIKAGVELIVTHTNAATAAARKVTASVPIVAAAFGDPVQAGLAESLARPGGNITGISLLAGETATKLVEFARAVAPKLVHCAVLGEPEGTSHQQQMKAVQAELANAGVKMLPLWVRTPRDVDAGFEAMRRERTEAVIVLLGAFLTSRKEQIAQLALRQKLPTYALHAEFPEAGSLLGYGASVPALFQRAATYVDKILKGAKPGELPVEQPTRFETVINLKTAKALGLTLPSAILVRADRIIE